MTKNEMIELFTQIQLTNVEGCRQIKLLLDEGRNQEADDLIEMMRDIRDQMVELELAVNRLIDETAN